MDSVTNENRPDQGADEALDLGGKFQCDRLDCDFYYTTLKHAIDIFFFGMDYSG